jgi:G3E family GTPase
VVAGFLGSGKTTLLQRLLPRLPGRSAIVVNDFGEARIDATLLDGTATLAEIPGGCVCCTAPEGLVPAVHALLDEVRPDRIFIEPSGLARPQDLVDMLARGGLEERVSRGPTLVLVDIARIRPNQPQYGLPDEVLAQIEAADVLIGSRADLADAEQLAAFHALAASLWPAPVRTVVAAQGVVHPGVLDAPAGEPRRSHDHAPHEGPCTPVCATSPAGHGHVGLSRVWGPEHTFAWDALRVALENAGPERVKGLFHGDIGWFRADMAGGRLHLAATGYRRDSRVDVILRDGPDAAARVATLEAALEASILVEATRDAEEPHVTLVGMDGTALTLTRAALAALPRQLVDVGTRVPGRSGSAVPLAEVLALAMPTAGARFVVSAADGMTTAPVPVAGLDALLVHTLDAAAVPDTQGGPFRLLVPPAGASGDAPARCANVKGVVRVRLIPGDS